MATSQNGWPVYTSAPSGRISWVTGRVRPGDVAEIFEYLGKRFNAEVEPIRKDWSWGWAYRAIRGATSGYSNHASGTAVDFNAPSHGLGVRGTFSAKQVNAIHAILKDLDGVIRWGGDYQNRVDSMHFEINASAAAVAKVAARLRKPAPAPAPKPQPVPVAAADQLSVMLWNVEDKNDAAADRKEIVSLLATYKPDVVAILEAYDMNLQGIAGYSFVYHAAKNYTSESRSIAFLVRDGVAVKRSEPLVMRLPWVGPIMAAKHDPRIHRYVTVNKNRKNYRVAAFHVPFGAKPVEETRKAAVNWLRTMGLLGPAIAVGDWNGLASSLVSKVGARASATVDGGGLDRAVYRGVRKVRGVNLGDRNRSDHDVKIWTFSRA